MRRIAELGGFVLLVAGISGTIDRLAYQPIMGPLLNVFNRLVIPRLEFLAGYEIFANLTLAVLGAVVLIAAHRIGTTPPPRGSA